MAVPRKKPADRAKKQTTTAKRVRKEVAQRPAQRAMAAMRADQQPSKPVTTAQQWKSATGFELEVPSGNVALMRRPGLQMFLEKGIIPNSLLPYVQKAMGGEDPEELKIQDFTTDQLQEMMDLYDAVTCICVIEPHVEPKTEGARDPDLLYVDEVDMDDKMFIFQWVVGGTRNLEMFRQQQESYVQRISSGKAVERTPELNDGNTG